LTSSPQSPAKAPPSAPTDKPYWSAWRWRPSITAVAGEGDPQLPAIHQARNFWNAELSKIRTLFSLGPVKYMTGDLRVKDFRRPFTARDLPEPLRAIDGDIIVALSDGPFEAFTNVWISPLKVLIQFQSDDTYPMTSPNTWPMTTPNTAPNIVAHELGHAIGLPHNANPTALMCGLAETRCTRNYPNQGFLPLTASDEARLAELYPPDWQDEKPGRRAA
jgi:hypothetical protein